MRIAERARTIAVLALVALGLAGCVTTTAPACPPGGRDRLVAELLFGRNIGGRVGVSEAAFRRFAQESVGIMTRRACVAF